MGGGSRRAGTEEAMVGRNGLEWNGVKAVGCYAWLKCCRWWWAVGVGTGVCERVRRDVMCAVGGREGGGWQVR